jgi:hypothetical protein
VNGRFKPLRDKTETPYHYAATRVVEKFGILVLIFFNRDKKQHTETCVFMH